MVEKVIMLSLPHVKWNRMMIMLMIASRHVEWIARDNTQNDNIFPMLNGSQIGTLLTPYWMDNKEDNAHDMITTR